MVCERGATDRFADAKLKRFRNDHNHPEERYMPSHELTRLTGARYADMKKQRQGTSLLSELCD
eukprot:4684091-Amphidinium_carterae.1